MWKSCSRRALVLGLLASFLATDASAILVVSLPWVRMSADTRSAVVGDELHPHHR